MREKLRTNQAHQNENNSGTDDVGFDNNDPENYTDTHEEMAPQNNIQEPFMGKY